MDSYGEREEKTGYESGEFQESGKSSIFQKEQKLDYRNYDRNNNNSWNSSSANDAKTKSGNFSNFRNKSSDYKFSGSNKTFNETPRIYKPYVGTGNPNTPGDILETFKEISELLDQNEYTVRTGGMEGPDDVFAQASHKELILPWKGFRGLESKFTFTSPEAKYFAKMFHPAYDSMKETVQTFLAKNVRMVMGQNLKSPALFVITYTEDGSETGFQVTPKTGNTGHVISIASALRLQVFNFGNTDAKDRLFRYLQLGKK